MKTLTLKKETADKVFDSITFNYDIEEKENDNGTVTLDFDSDLDAKKFSDELLNQKLIKRLKQNWAITAKEPIEIQVIKGIAYAYGSELATLRLIYSYRLTKHAYKGYSTNLETHYFSLDLSI